MGPTGQKAGPPPRSWVKAWLETKMAMDSMTKDELRVWRLIQNKIGENSTQHDVSGQRDDGPTVSPATAQERTDSMRRVTELLEAKPGTFVFTFRAPYEHEPDEPTRIQESNERNRFSISKHVDERPAGNGEPGRMAGALILDWATTVHRVRFYTYEKDHVCIPLGG